MVKAFEYAAKKNVNVANEYFMLLYETSK